MQHVYYDDDDDDDIDDGRTHNMRYAMDMNTNEQRIEFTTLQ